MKVADLVKQLNLQVRSARAGLAREVTGGYCSDLMSDVLANGRTGEVWVTLQTHQNIVAVASMRELSAVILVNGRQPEEGTIQRAESERIPVLVSRLSAFELVGRLYDLGVRSAAIDPVVGPETD